MKFMITNGSLFGFECEEYEKEVIIPDGVTCIESEAFREIFNIESVVMPDSVTRIESLAFLDCWNLSEIRFSDNLKYAGHNAFENTKWLSEQKDGMVIINRNLLYCYQGSEKDVIIPDNITYIAEGAFYENKRVESIIMSDNILKTGSSAFGGCTNLRKIRLSENLSEIESYLFCRCFSLKEIRIPDKVTRICYASFDQCMNLESLTFPEKHITIDPDVFEDTKWLLNYESDFVIIHDTLYKYKGKQADVMIPDNIRIICNEAFAENPYIENVIMPDSVTQIGSSQQCFSDGVFHKCRKLKSVRLSDNLLYIGENAFYKCSSLECIEIPKSVKTIGSSAFYGCTSLRKIDVMGKPKISTNAFEKTKPRYDWVTAVKYDEFKLSYNDEKKEYCFSFRSGKEIITHTVNGTIPEIINGLTSYRDISTGRYGYKNKIGDITIPAEYDMVQPFSSDGYAVVVKKEKFGIINTQGESVIKAIHDFIRSDFPDLIAAVRFGGKWGFISVKNTSRYLVKPSFEEVSDCICGYAAVRKNGKWGLIRINFG